MYEDFLLFDGKYLYWYNKGKIDKKFPAYSGPGKGFNILEQRNVGGPIIGGLYKIDPRDIDIFGRDYLKKEAAWGKYRVRLIESLEAKIGRKIFSRGRGGGFYIHGGYIVGTAGCIEIAEKKEIDKKTEKEKEHKYEETNKNLHKFFKKLHLYGRIIDLEVNYSGKSVFLINFFKSKKSRN